MNTSLLVYLVAARSIFSSGRRIDTDVERAQVLLGETVPQLTVASNNVSGRAFDTKCHRYGNLASATLSTGSSLITAVGVASLFITPTKNALDAEILLTDPWSMAKGGKRHLKIPLTSSYIHNRMPSELV